MGRGGLTFQVDNAFLSLIMLLFVDMFLSHDMQFLRFKNKFLAKIRPLYPAATL